MDNTKNDFDNRKIEVEDYFTFLEIIDGDETRIKYITNGNTVEEKISNKLQTIFIANTFLILYNLIESTVRNSIVEIYIKIQEVSDVNYFVRSASIILAGFLISINAF